MTVAIVINDVANIFRGYGISRARRESVPPHLLIKD